MEVNRILQNVIVAHHIIQVVSLVVDMIICGATAHYILMLFHLPPILPTFVFVIFWIASKCNYQNLRHILVHFNFILCMLWFITVLPICIISTMALMFTYRHHYLGGADEIFIVVAVVNGILSLSSISFAVCAIWKAARNVVLKAKRATPQHVDVQTPSPFQPDTRNMFTNHNGIRMPQATYRLPMWSQRY